MRLSNFVEGLLFMAGFLALCLVVRRARPLSAGARCARPRRASARVTLPLDTHVGLS